MERCSAHGRSLRISGYACDAGARAGPVKLSSPIPGDGSDENRRIAPRVAQWMAVLNRFNSTSTRRQGTEIGLGAAKGDGGRHQVRGTGWLFVRSAGRAVLEAGRSQIFRIRLPINLRPLFCTLSRNSGLRADLVPNSLFPVESKNRMCELEIEIGKFPVNLD